MRPAPHPALCFVLLSLAPLLGGASAKEEGARLEQIRVELEQRRAAMKDLDNQRRSLVESLGELDESLAGLTEDAEAARRKHEALKADLVTLEARTGLDEEALEEAKGRLAARLRALYVAGDGGAARALLGAEGFEELALRRRFLQKLAESDAKLIEEVARIEATVREQRAKLAVATREAELTARLIEEQRAILEAARDERNAAIGRIQSERELALRQAKELEHKRLALSAFLRNLVEEQHRRPLAPAGGRGKGILRGGLASPVDGIVIRRFGVVKDKDTKAEIVSNGIEVRAEEGSPVSAVADGRVAHVGWMRGFGRVVIVDHGEGHHTISAHLSRPAVARGDEVRRGQTIGFVGDTESTNGPKLYFELRENSRPRDPLPYLK
jgi:murein hydrolase activator